MAHCLSVVESWGVYAMLYTGLYFGQTNLYMGGAALKPYDCLLYTSCGAAAGGN